MSVRLSEPLDVHDQALVDAVHPADWENPSPAGRYNLVVIGGGPAGLVAAFGAAGLGAKVALVEKHLLGGDCLNGGCVPSKALLRSAHAASRLRHADALGVSAEVHTDFGAVMERMRAIRAGIAPHDSAERLSSEGIDVFLGEARFTGADRLEVDGVELRFARACVATGARASVPPIPGLADAGAMTNEELFALTEAPDRLVVIGAGVIGSEMAQAFAGFGTVVHLVDLADRVLSREDPEASALVQEALERDGVHLHLGSGVERVERRGDTRTVVLDDGTRVEGDAVLVAVGRRPNTDLALDKAGVAFGRGGIEVNDHLQTTNPRVFAAGDVIGQAQLTHAADHQARLVLKNALFFGKGRVSELVIPRVTYTWPEVAAVGLSSEEAEKNGRLTAWTALLAETDRGRTDGDAGGFCRVWADDQGRIHGATIVGENAGELLAPVTLAMTHGLTLGQLASTIHPYPTRSEVVFKVASLFNKSRLKPWMSPVLEGVMKFRR